MWFNRTSGHQLHADGIRICRVEKQAVIAFLHKDISQLVGKKLETEDGNKKKLLEGFRALAQQKMCKFWMNKDELGSVVSRSLIQQIKIKPAIGWVRANLVADESAAQEILRLRRRVEEFEKLIPNDTAIRPEVRSMDYFKKLAEKYPRNAIQEAWSYVVKALNYASITHDLNPTQDYTAQMTNLYAHGEVEMEDFEILNQCFNIATHAEGDPQFKLSSEEVLDQINAMLRFSKQLVEKSDGVWTIRRDISVS